MFTLEGTFVKEAFVARDASTIPIQTPETLVGPTGHVFVIDNGNTLLPL